MLSKTSRFMQLAGVQRQAVRSFSSLWGFMEPAPADPILGINDAFKKDTNPKKQLLGVGAYRDDDNKPYILDCVRKAEEMILAKGMDHEYAGIDGIATFKQKAIELAYGADSQAIKSGRVASCQTLSGTGSLRVGLDFLREWYPNKKAKVYVADPTWPTHKGISQRAGFDWQEHRYYDRKNRGFDLNGMLEDLDKADNEQIILLHLCAHNPTGCDPTRDQWAKILEVIKRKKHFAAFDSAYQGFASGDLAADAYSLRLFSENYDRVCLFQSMAKNFGLYGERAGCLSFLCADEKEANIVNSRIKMIARPMYSNPPVHGARVVDIILNDPQLTASWHADLKKMSGRMSDMRSGLVSRLKSLGNKNDWSHVTSQIGMFAYTGLNKDQVTELRDKHGIYMTADGRISIAGLNTKNLDYIAECFHAVTKDKGL
jgi:aspartate aminotransferase, mitochondrial